MVDYNDMSKNDLIELITGLKEEVDRLKATRKIRSGEAGLSDITDREVNKYITTAEYSEILHRIPAGIYIFLITAAGEMSFVYGSSKYCQMLRVTKEELLANPAVVLDKVHPDDRPSLDEANRQAWLTHKPFRWEGRSEIDGEMKWARIESIPTILPNGDSYWNGIMIDITEQKKVESALISSEEKFRSLFNNMIEGSALHELIYDESSTPYDYKIIDVNSSFERILGLNKENILNKTSREAYGVADPPFIDIYTKTVETGESLVFETSYPPLNKYFSISVYKTHSNGFATTFQDITERKRWEDDLNNKNAELERFVKEKDKFFSIIAHDLRSPFLGLLGLTEILADDAAEMEKDVLLKFSKSVHNNAQNIFELLKNLLEWSQMQKGSIPFDQTVFSLNYIIDSNIESLAERASQKEVQIVNKFTESVNVMADRNMINSVVLNLLTNAIKFSKRGGYISFDIEALDDKMVEVSVRDKGVGMDSESVAKLFQPGEKTGSKGTDGESGTGLGLLLCKEFVEKNGGTIRVESKAGVGSKFSFTLKRSTGH
ncbi:MAG: PAS domain S-box protein [Ignavibacteria bacterium]|nr:PAS domain S-box protein [Ignavibacteria bacterium]